MGKINHWNNFSLGDLLEQPKSGVSVLVEDKIPSSDAAGVLRLSCISGGRFNHRDKKKPLEHEVGRLEVFAERNTILISRSNTPALVGATAFVGDDYPNAYLPDTLWMLCAKNTNALSMRWLAYILGSESYRLSLQRIASGTSDSMKKIQKGAFLKIKVCLPPLFEQRKIADILTTWDEALEKLDALITSKERRKKALMQQLLAHSSSRALKGHSLHKLNDIIERVTRRNTDEAENVLTISGQDGLVNQQDYFNRNISGADLSKYYLLRRGEFAYNRSASKGYPYGAIKRLNKYPTGVVSTLYLCFSLKRKVPVVSNYLCHYFEDGCLNAGLRSIAKEGARAHGLLNVTAEEFFDLDILLPSLDEQHQIAKILDICDEELRLLRVQRIALDRQKRGLMQKLLTGAIRVRKVKHG